MNAASTWKKVPAALAVAFDAALPASPLVQRRQMFGCPCAFVNGHMFAGLPPKAAKAAKAAEAAKTINAAARRR